MKKNTWISYKDYIGEREMLVRVDTKYRDSHYKHTYIISYTYNNKHNLPSTDEIKKIYKLEDDNEKIINNIFNGQVVYLGTATFGGKFYLIYASNLQLKWNEFIKSTFNIDNSYVYFDDNMKYYHQILIGNKG